MDQFTLETFGKYFLLRKIGAGGMAEVFLARPAVFNHEIFQPARAELLVGVEDDRRVRSPSIADRMRQVISLGTCHAVKAGASQPDFPVDDGDLCQELAAMDVECSSLAVDVQIADGDLKMS